MTDLTVVIPVYNQSDALALTLHGFTVQPEPYRRTPIIVVDDGSSEPIGSVVHSFSDKLNLTYKRLERCGRAAARNQGAAEADGGIVVFCDADRIPAPQFLQAHHQTHLQSDDALVIGQVREIYVSDIVAERERVLAYWADHRKQRIPQYCRLVYRLYDEWGRASPTVPWISAFSGNMSIRKERFAALGGFDEGFREWGFEHFEFGYRAYQQGVPYRYHPQAANIHLAHRRSGPPYEELIRRSHQYFLQKHPDLVVEKFLDFMLGQVSLQELVQCVQEQDHLSAAQGTYDPLVVEREPLYVRITNF
ncbi:glycosyltransferase [Brevibacillus humidisoli]|uniref:glycosyltransferase family 2 protein n=1 Tax=Brevibacillus humidisoli TaxID=2895522 RepID=UPI001E2C36D1|nr:glycosyltransferase [Brevibacillus humidisoli]UFJ42403.1 glycosyltransferase [Brevibacillus humidisoli]